MRIIECYVEGFGTLSKKKYLFTPGFNSFNEENGSGKTTLSAFIRVMLYGMSDTKKTNLEENDRKHYMPWNGGACGGTLTFEANRKTYRVERSFAQKASGDTFSLYDLTLGRESNDYTDQLGVELFGIDADGAERTVFLSERALSPKSDNKSISAKLSNLVGCDADICDMDDALSRLETERKFYYKKGGSGELGDIKSKITEITRRIEGLEETEAALATKEARLSEIAKESDRIREETRMLVKEREEATLRVAKAGYEKLHREMKDSVEESVRESERLLGFFGGNPPSFDEIDDAYFKSAEAKRLEESAGAVGGGEEFKALQDYFRVETSEEEIAKLRSATKIIAGADAQIQSPEYLRIKRKFSKRIPEKSEIDSLIEARKKKRISSIILFSISAVLLAISILFAIVENPLLILGAAPALALVICAIVLTKRGERAMRRCEEEFFSSISDEAIPSDANTLAALEMLSRLLDEAKELLSGEKNEAERKTIAAMEAKFPYAKDAEEIIEKYDRYKALLVAEQYMQRDRVSKLNEASALRTQVGAFLSRFKTVSDDPFTELRRNLTEYNMLNAKILSKRSEMEHLGAMHSLGEGAERKAELSVEQIDERRRMLEERAAELSRELALTERTCKEYEGALDERDELVMKRAELEEKLISYKENYEIILLTKKYLTAARDNMTSRYLGRTKASFEKYAAEISGIVDEEFMMSTDFGISKLDSGATRSSEAYSRGTRDLYNFATRLALVDSLYEGERPFIILDDPFSALDDKRTRAALRLLENISRERQIIYFTCSKSREA